MAIYQVWAKDRYNRHEIITAYSKAGRPESEWATPEAALEAARRYAHEKNRNNPLTYEEQQRAVSYLVFQPENAIYAGALIQGEKKALYKTASTPEGDKWEELPLQEGAVGSFYCGQTPEGTPWLFTDLRRRPVTTLGHEQLDDKTLLFVHPQ